jgi:hypothetical protein
MCSFHQTHGDTTGDGRLDHGVVDGVNRYGIGVIEFAARLRQRMGDDFLILADGALGPGGSRSQRAFQLFNGIESEGWPNLNDWDFDDWSGGLNRHRFWQQNAHAPAFSYINHKWIVPIAGKPGEQTVPEVPFSRHRLVFAAAQFTDAMLCYSFPPPRDQDGQLGIWDEFRAGTEDRLGWLGRPEGPAIHLATRTPDLAAQQRVLERLGGAVTVQQQDGQWTISPRQADAADVVFSVPEIATTGSDLLVKLRMTGQPRADYPATMARFAQVELSGGAQSLMDAAPCETGMGLRGQSETPIDDQTGARVIYRPQQEIGGLTLDAYFVHPPYQNAKGYVYWCRDVEIARSRRTAIQLGDGREEPRAIGRHLVSGLGRGDHRRPAWSIRQAVRTGYQGASVDSVPRSAGQVCRPADTSEVRRRLRAARPRSDRPRILGQRQDRRRRPPGCERYAGSVSHDLGEQPAVRFVFYFRNIRSDTVRLTIRIEGPEPVTLERFEVYAAPDAMARVFEHGLVLANPSLAPLHVRSRVPLTGPSLPASDGNRSPGHDHQQRCASAIPRPTRRTGRDLPSPPRLTSRRCREPSSLEFTIHRGRAAGQWPLGATREIVNSSVTGSGAVFE